MGGPLPLALASTKGVVPVVGQLEGLAAESDGGDVGALRRRLATAPKAPEGPLAFLRQQAEAVYKAADRLKAATSMPPSSLAYEGELGDQLRKAAQILAGGVGVRVLYASQGGYDTHAEQAVNHGNALEALARALAAFDEDLRARNLADRVMVLVFSEFGRRVAENASLGTDHGAASCCFLVGDGLRGGLAGRHPGLDALDDGDLIHTTDFRSVYATLLDRWLGCPHEAILGGRFPTLDLFRSPA